MEVTPDPINSGTEMSSAAAYNFECSLPAMSGSVKSWISGYVVKQVNP
jgi:hypothetical protein